MVEIEPLKMPDFETVATWLSNPAINQWLASGWRGKQVDAKTLAIVTMKPVNRLFLVRYQGTPCGLVALGCIDALDKTGTLWYLLGDSARSGRGTMTEAVRQVIQVAFDELGLRSITASIMVGNTRSRRILEKNGFKEVGILRQGLTFNGQAVDRILFDRLVTDLAITS